MKICQLLLNQNKLNLIFLLASLLLAWIFPFKLFLFSYIVLGPLHYLSEINWLKEKSFYLDQKNFWLYFSCFLVLLMSVFPITGQIKFFSQSMPFAVRLGENFSYFLTFSFLLSAFWVFKNKWARLIIGVALILIILAIGSVFQPDLLMIGLLLPGLIHVYGFTIIFMISGYLKRRRIIELITCLGLILLPLLFAILPTDPLSSYSWRFYYFNSGFAEVNRNIHLFFGLNLEDAVVRFQMFVAFAYTFHYLNWFAKTNVIGWGKALGKVKLTWLIILWLGLISFYCVNYQLALSLLFALSLLHVVLEFPLNWIVLKSIFGAVRIGRKKN